MKTLIIEMPNHKGSKDAAERCRQSLKDLGYIHRIDTLQATTCIDYEEQYKRTGLVYDGEVNNPHKAACAMSHFRCWELALAWNEPLFILEHDALFTKLPETWRTGYNYLCMLQKVPYGTPYNGIQPQRRLDARAYIITPEGAEEAIDLARDKFTQHDRKAFNDRMTKIYGVTDSPIDRSLDHMNLRTSHHG